MYHYANRPGLSTQRSRQTISQWFNTSTNGLPGNDGACLLVSRDFASILLISLHFIKILVCSANLISYAPTASHDSYFLRPGAMGSYVVFYLAGLYPLPATRQFLLSSPYFPSISFHNPLLNSTTTIKANNFTGNPADGTSGNIFVKVSTYLSPVMSNLTPR